MEPRETRYRQSQQALWRFTLRGVLLLSADDQLVELNGSGRVLWEALRHPRTLDEATAEVGGHFGMPPEEVRAAIQSTLDQLVNRCLVEVDDAIEGPRLTEGSGVI